MFSHSLTRFTLISLDILAKVVANILQIIIPFLSGQYLFDRLVDFVNCVKVSCHL